MYALNKVSKTRALLCRSTQLGSNTLRHVSVPYCFITLLHLCNERNLVLQPLHGLSNGDLQSIDALGPANELLANRNLYLGDFGISQHS